MAAEVAVSMSSMPESLSQEINNSSELSSIILNYYRNGTLTDVTFRIKCGDDWIVQKAHKVVLAMWSPVFADMFYGPDAMKEDTVVITDVTPQVFTAMIKFTYGSVCDLNRMALKKDISFQLKMLQASQSYQIKYLESITRSNVASIQPDKYNVFHLLDACRLIGAEGRVKDCQKLLQTNTAEVLQSHDLSEFTRDMMMIILGQMKLSLVSEFELVMWVFSWAKIQQENHGNDKKLRSILDDVLGHVDLTAMEAKEFGRILKNHEGVFTESECCKIFRNIVDPGCCDPPEWAQIINRDYGKQ